MPLRRVGGGTVAWLLQQGPCPMEGGGSRAGVTYDNVDGFPSKAGCNGVMQGAHGCCRVSRVVATLSHNPTAPDDCRLATLGPQIAVNSIGAADEMKGSWPSDSMGAAGLSRGRPEWAVRERGISRGGLTRSSSPARGLARLRITPLRPPPYLSSRRVASALSAAGTPDH